MALEDLLEPVASGARGLCLDGNVHACIPNDIDEHQDRCVAHKHEFCAGHCDQEDERNGSYPISTTQSAYLEGKQIVSPTTILAVIRRNIVLIPEENPGDEVEDREGDGEGLE